MDKHTREKHFWDRVAKVHGDKYDYSKSIFIETRAPIEIICKEHGIFWQRAARHVEGKGCPGCGKEVARHKKRKETGEFIQEAIKIHGEKYDYSFVKYTTRSTNVKIICPEHGSFWQLPSCHLNGSGCFACGVKKQSDAKRKLQDDFIKESLLVHGDKYDYSKVKYKQHTVPVEIVCRTHGSFWQQPKSHLRGNGCKECSGGGFRSNQAGVLYLVKIVKPYCSFWKIGITNFDAKKRLSSDYKYVVEKHEWTMDGTKAKEVERTMLKKFKKYKLEGFLFPLLVKDGDTECFTLKLPSLRVIRCIEKEIN